MTESQRRLLGVATRKLMDSLREAPDFMHDDESKACFVVLITLDSAINTGRAQRAGRGLRRVLQTE